MRRLFFNHTCTEQGPSLRPRGAGLTWPTPVERRDVWELGGFLKSRPVPCWAPSGSCWHTVRPSALSSPSWTERDEQTTDNRDLSELWLCLPAPCRVQSLPFIPCTQPSSGPACSDRWLHVLGPSRSSRVGAGSVRQ